MNNIKIEKGYKYIDEVKRLIKLYMSELNRNLDFQDFDEELKHLEQKYAQPQGIILVAQNKNKDILTRNSINGSINSKEQDEVDYELTK